MNKFVILLPRLKHAYTYTFVEILLLSSRDNHSLYLSLFFLLRDIALQSQKIAAIRIVMIFQVKFRFPLSWCLGGTIWSINGQKVSSVSTLIFMFIVVIIYGNALTIRYALMFSSGNFLINILGIYILSISILYLCVCIMICMRNIGYIHLYIEHVTNITDHHQLLSNTHEYLWYTRVL